MNITPLIKEGSKVIQSYSSEGITINGDLYAENIIVTPDQVAAFSDKSFKEINKKDFEIFEGKAIDVLLVGTGETQQFFSKEIKDYLKDMDIISETMTSGAAARTYNVLMTEGRNVVALFFI